VEGLAIRIVRGDVPEGLKNRTLVSLDMGSLIAGAKFRGEFEERLKAVLKKLPKRREGYLFIDELHTVVVQEPPKRHGRRQPAQAHACRVNCTASAPRRLTNTENTSKRQGTGTQIPDRAGRPAIRRGYHIDPARLRERYEVHHASRYATRPWSRRPCCPIAT